MDETKVEPEVKLEPEVKETSTVSTTTTVVKVEEKQVLPELPKNGPSVDDIKFKLNTDQSLGKQAAEVVDYVATISTIKDEKVVEEIKKEKAVELVTRAEKAKVEVQKELSHEELEKQKSEHERNETIFRMFGVFYHLPAGAHKWMKAIATPIAIFFMTIIGIPCLIVNCFLNGINSIAKSFAEITVTAKKMVFVFGIAFAIFVVYVILFAILHQYAGVHWWPFSAPGA